jgi:hypothetical protein
MMTLTLWSIVVWFVWGFFMGAGWWIAQWLLAKVIR